MAKPQKKKKGKRPARGNKVKYDWPSLRQEFFESEIDECKAFFESIYGKFTGHMSKKVIGWPKEKRAWKEDQVQKALDRISADRAKAAMKLLDRLFVQVERAVIQIERSKDAAVDEINTLQKVIRTEAGLPSTIHKQENVDVNKLDDAQKSLNEKINARQKATPKKGRRAAGIRGSRAKKKSNKG